jgi:hypothetical protein
LHKILRIKRRAHVGEAKSAHASAAVHHVGVMREYEILTEVGAR